jgi:hypothetical protein
MKCDYSCNIILPEPIKIDLAESMVGVPKEPAVVFPFWTAATAEPEAGEPEAAQAPDEEFKKAEDEEFEGAGEPKAGGAPDEGIKWAKGIANKRLAKVAVPEDNADWYSQPSDTRIRALNLEPSMQDSFNFKQSTKS